MSAVPKVETAQDGARRLFRRDIAEGFKPVALHCYAAVSYTHLDVYKRQGFNKDTMTGHGFRAMASTRLNEMGWAPDVIERQLAHAERNKVRAAYNRAQYLSLIHI